MKIYKTTRKVEEIEVNDDQLEKFYLYMKLLLEWNEKMNLTAITEPKDIITKHSKQYYQIYIKKT